MNKTLKIVALFSLCSSTTVMADTTACASCHGINFEKKAMNVSKIVKDMSKDEIITALKGYTSGNYGGAMKTLMQSQVAGLDDSAIKALADEIKK